MPGRDPRTMRRTARNFSLLLLAGGLIALLLVLGPNLDRVELAPGRLNPDPPTGVATTSPGLGTGAAGAVGYAIFLRVLFIAALVCLAIIAIGAIFKKSMRIYLISFVVILAMIWGIYELASRRPYPEPREQEPSGLTGLLQETPQGPAAEDSIEEPPPSWSFTAMAILLSIGVAVLLTIVWAKFAPRWRRRDADDGPTELDELVETLGAAADEIELGSDPRSAVLRCYREMVRILCRNRPIDHLHMTAREVADALHRAGFTLDHVDRLTEIFELVRYGNRSGEPLAERALGCLNAIREAYAT